MVILLVPIDGYFINDYWWILIVILLLPINGYSIGAY